MNAIPTIVDFEDKTHDPFALEELANGDTEDLYTPLTRLAERAPVHKGDLLTLLGRAPDSNFGSVPSFTVMRYEEILAVLSDPATFSIDAYKTNAGQTFGNTLSLMDPPEHTAIRKVFQKAFLPNIVSKWVTSWCRPS